MSRDSLLRQWFFGSTPDRVVDLAQERDIPVIVYGSYETLSGRLEDAVFVVKDVIERQFTG